MGYTHYWNQTRSLTDKEWETICKQARELFHQNKDILANTMAEKGTEPEIEGDFISFNGVGEDGHESAYLDKVPQSEFNFCKTARKPYDGVVVDFLKMARGVAPDALKLSSDGGNVFD